MLGKLAKSLALAVMLSTVTACGGLGSRPNTYPPAPLVKVEQEPLPGADVFESEEAANLYESEHQSWAERGWARVGEICRDAVRKGAPYPKGWCPDPPVEETD